MKDTAYFAQTQLLLQVLPYVALDKDFALKGGTAINLFIRDMPRLSVDIDLTYLPLENRENTLQKISEKLISIATTIRSKIFGSFVEEMRPFGTKQVSKLSVKHLGAKIIIEPNLILRGHVYPIVLRPLSQGTSALFKLAVSMQVMSLADIYGGKICAALDRQHPRDLFDVKILFENEGITEEIRKAFIVYLISGDRPIHELLNPNRIDIQSSFVQEFASMTREPVEFHTLIKIREHLIEKINDVLTNDEREFLISVKRGEPKWELLNLVGIEHLPGIQWKLINIRKMNLAKREKQLESLKKVLHL